MKVLKITVFVVLLMGLGACGNLRIKAYQPFQAPAKAQKIVLTSFYMGRPELPKVPAADAEAFNKKVYQLEGDLKQLMERKAAEFYGLLDQGMEAQLNVECWAGNELEAGPRYARSAQKQELEALQVAGARHFNSIILAEGGLTFFEFKEGKVAEFMEGSPRLKSAVRSNLKNLGADMMAVAHARLAVERVTRYGQKANLKLMVDVYVFDEQGRSIGHAYGETVPVTTDGTQLSDFELVLDQYSALQQEVLTELTKVED